MRMANGQKFGMWQTLRFPPDAHRQGEVDPERVLYAYSDETEFTFPRRNGRRRIGTGIFLTTEPITERIIGEALDGLAADPALNSQDRRTLDNGYFHASDDTRRAMRALAEVIRTQLTGTFFYYYRDPELRPPRRGKPKTHRYQELMLKFGTLAMSSTRSRIVLTVEDRPKAKHLNDPSWIDRLYTARERGVYDTPAIPMLFPEMEVRVEDKKRPGLQIVDLLLWATNRSAAVQAHDLAQRSEDDWTAIVGLEPAYGHASADGADRGGVYYINRVVPDIHITYPLGKPVPDTLGKNGLLDAWGLIERCLHHYGREGLPGHAQHHYPALREVTEKLSGDGPIGVEELWRAGSVFIRLFDTIPVYEGAEDGNEHEWKLLLYARRIASLIQRKDLVHGMSAVAAVARWRRHVVEQTPEFLGLRPRDNGTVKPEADGDAE